MAVKDVKEYFNKMADQYFEMKGVLEDFNEAFKNGQITEDRLDSVKEEVEIIQTNYERLAYIMYLIDLPVRKKKQPKFNKMNKKKLEELARQAATAEDVAEENDQAIENIKSEINKLI